MSKSLLDLTQAELDQLTGSPNTCAYGVDTAAREDCGGRERIDCGALPFDCPPAVTQ